MDDVGGDDRIGWIADGLAAGALGASVGASLHLIGQSLTGVGAATVTVLLTLALLRRVKPEPRRFKLPIFDLQAPVVQSWADPAPEPLLLTELAPNEDVLVLDDPLEPPQHDSRVVQLFADRTLPTPGELRQRIEDHLGATATQRSATVLDLEVDASAALRQALGELRRSLA